VRTETLPGPPPLVVDVYEPADRAATAALWIHGFGSRRDGEKVRHAGDALAAAGSVLLAPDLQGHGASGGSFADLTIGRSIGDVVRVAQHPLFRDAVHRVLIGSSFGGLVAAWCSVDHPEVCDRLVLIAPAFGLVERHLASLPEDQAAAWRRGEPLRIVTEWLDARLSNRILREAEERTVADLAARLAKPTLILHGRQDEQVPVRASLDFFDACAFPGLDLFLVGGGDHRLTDHRALLADQILRYLG
jgi:pimeloyl-ACP methyl ester carboxylesterase